MEIAKIIEESQRFLMNTYNRFPIVLVKGRGTRVWDSEGKEYIDFVGGVAVNVIGHCHPKIVVALQKQAQRLIHVSNFYHIEPQIKLAKLLVKNSFAEKVFFCNSGAEANEAAIKLARKYSKTFFREDRYEIISTLNSFHGRTFASLTATGQEKFQKGFEPLLPGFKYVPFDNIDALKDTISSKTCAIILEPIQGEGGVKIPSGDYLKRVSQICKENKLLLILDEVQTGMGRTGKLFAYEHYGIKPDIMTIAKGLGGGVPIGALLTTEKIASVFEPGTHASTFGGNPLVCAAAIATLETILEDGYLLDHCRRMGKYFLEKLVKIKEKYPEIVYEVRGKGLLIGMELTMEGASIVKACLERGFLINCTAGKVLRFTPPLIIVEEEIDKLTITLKEIIEQYREKRLFNTVGSLN
ncbi:MAG: acetylornithine transaminase [Thermodesulfovibrionales bacterium]|nr:acetylornithine transaminase [Thermodesulfovibrionales bacterium]